MIEFINWVSWQQIAILSAFIAALGVMVYIERAADRPGTLMSFIVPILFLVAALVLAFLSIMSPVAAAASILFAPVIVLVTRVLSSAEPNNLPGRALIALGFDEAMVESALKAGTPYPDWITKVAQLRDAKRIDPADAEKELNLLAAALVWKIRHDTDSTLDRNITAWMLSALWPRDADDGTTHRGDRTPSWLAFTEPLETAWVLGFSEREAEGLRETFRNIHIGRQK